MKKLYFLFLLLLTPLYAEVINKYPTQELIDSGITIIDIRTEQEWKETGLIKGAVPITFWYSDGSYNIPLFMNELQKHISPNKPFALVCHVGNRTREVSHFLSEEFKMKVINLLGGMEYLKQQGYKTTPYQPGK